MGKTYLTSSLAGRVRDEVFTLEEQILLRKTIGNTYIDIADQLLFHYGKYWMRIEDEGEFIKACAIIKFQKGEYYLRQLAVLNKELKNLMNPILFYSTVRNEGTSNTSLSTDNESSSDSNNSTGSFSYEFSESANQTASASLSKGAVTQTSQKNKEGLEKKWRKHPLIEVSGQLVGKKEFDPNKVLQKEKVLDVREAHYEVIPQEDDLTELAEGDLYSTMNLGIVGDRGKEYAASNTDNLGLSRSDGNTNSRSGTTSITDFTVDKTFTQYIANEAAMKSIRLRIPRLQLQFFTLFLELFKEPFI